MTVLKIYLESLGCSRNQVDSEIMLGKLERAGHEITDRPESAQVIIVNTCTFISTASDEAVDVILAMAGFKKTGCLERLIVTGCLAQRYKDDKDLVCSLPEVDAFLGTAACEQIVEAVEGKETGPLTLFPDPGQRKFQNIDENRKLLNSHLAYLKISEGCSRKCTYCIIPSLRGPQRSRPEREIVREALKLEEQGVKEIILTAENTTDYGRDFPEKKGLENILDSLAANLFHTPARIRFLYTHPSTLSMDIVRTVRKHKNICSYYDVPVQHASTKILKKMGRSYTREDLYQLFQGIRDNDPDAALRTTLIVGFPGETDQDFETLLQFVRDVEFDHLGVFIYSDSDDLKSHTFKQHVAEDIAEKRHDIIMQTQAEITRKNNEKYIGSAFEVLVEENPEEGVYLGRTGFQAPEVDGITFIYANGLEIGSFVEVQVTDAFEYDIAGQPA